MNDPIAARNIENYASAWSIAEYGGEVGLRPVEADLVRERFPAAPARVLDLGCGAGRTTIALAQQGFDVLGIDLSEPLLRVARERYPSLAFTEMDATALTLESGSFAAALFSYNGIDCIYPRDARRRCFREVHRVLAPGGIFILSSHNVIGATFSGGFFYLQGYLNAAKFAAAQLTNRLAPEWYLRYDDPGGTQYLFSAPPDRTIADATAAGFEIVAVRGTRGEADLNRVRMREKHVHFVLRKA